MEKLEETLCCKLIEELVAIESLSGKEERASAFLVDQFTQLGYDQAYVDEAGSAVGIRGEWLPDVPGSKRIVLLGHIDTVPGNIPVRIEDGILHGRGSVDAKGPLATFVAAGAMAELPRGVQLVVAGAVEEESATSKGARQISRDFVADYCVIGEPSSSSAITLGYKGRILVDYRVSVDEGHTAGPQKNAAELATGFWFRVLEHCREFNANHPKLFDQLLPSLRKINSSSDGITSNADARLGIRLPLESPDFSIAAFIETLQSFADSGQIETWGCEPAWRSGRNNQLVRALATAIRGAGLKAGYKVKTGTADMNVVAPVWNCPIVAYGPGDSSLDHTPCEHLHLDEYLEAIRILTGAITSLAASTDLSRR